jgi:cob(I)alamin adenosyltransferase
LAWLILSMTISFRSWSESCLSTVNKFLTACAGAGAPARHARRCRQYITKLSKVEHEAPEWQAAMEALILVVTLGGPTMFARIGVMRALNRNIERTFKS